MNPNRVDSLVDLSYGLLIFAAVALMVVVGTQSGIAFGLGVLVSYALHVVWKMGRFDPEWMTREVAQRVEEDLSEDVTESVEESVAESVEESVTETVEESVAEDVAETVEANIAEDVAKNVEESVADQVSDTVEETISEEVEDVREKVEEVNERVDRRPRADEVEAAVEGTADEDSGDEKASGE